jgi:hypothetical protein
MSHRQHVRYSIRVPLLHNAKSSGTNHAGMGWTRNIGEGGACVELTERLQPDGPILIRLQTAKGAIELEAKVIWSKEATSEGDSILHGVAFTQIAPDQLASLRDLLRSRGPVRHSGVRLPLDVSVTCRPKDQAKGRVEGRTGDFGRGGLLLRLPEELPVGSKLEVTLHTPREPLTVSGVVVWVDPPEQRVPGDLVGHGFRFTSLGPSLSMALAFLLAEPL